MASREGPPNDAGLRRPGPTVRVDADVERVIEILLGIPAEDAERIRTATRTRPRPRPQRGPSADYR